MLAYYITIEWREDDQAYVFRPTVGEGLSTEGNSNRVIINLSQFVAAITTFSNDVHSHIINADMKGGPLSQSETARGLLTALISTLPGGGRGGTI